MFVYKHIETIEYVEKQANFLRKIQFTGEGFYNNNSQNSSKNHSKNQFDFSTTSKKL